MKLRTVAAALLIALGALCQPSREDRWRQDIDSLVAGLAASGNQGQKDFRKLYPPETFDPTISKLKESFAQLSDAEVVLQLMRIMALGHVAHNTIQLPRNSGFERQLPLTFYWYTDGLAVVSASKPYAEALGLRVLTIGSMTPAALLQAMSPYISHENDVWLRLNAQRLLTLGPFLEHFQLQNADGTVAIELARLGREPFILRVPLSPTQDNKIAMQEALGLSAPFAMTQPGKKYWGRYLEESRALYIQYNVCANDAKKPFTDFVRGVMAEADHRSATRVIVDLRWNGGGDSRVVAPLRKAIAARPQFAGRTYVLIGPNTFSSAIDNAVEFKRDLRATLVGEPSGGNPSEYGEVKTLTLPNSQLVVRYTSKYFARKSLADGPLRPDLATAYRLSDAVAGRDPALETALTAK